MESNPKHSKKSANTIVHDDLDAEMAAIDEEYASKSNVKQLTKVQ